MEYRGKNFSILQGIGPNSWKWTVQLDRERAKSGESPTRAAAKASASWAIDKALAHEAKTTKSFSTPGEQQ
jgi:hypothetical protein